MATITQEKAESEMRRKWCDLPIDILGNVIGKLYWADRVRFRAVCKSWQLPLAGVPAIEEFPWLLSFVKEESEKRVIKLLDPFRKKSYIVKEFRGEETKNLRDFFWTSRYGWIMCNKEMNFRDDRFILSTLLFSPFTGEIIEFPDLEIKLENDGTWCVPSASFYINPASPECVVYVVWRRWGWVLMSICSPGDTIWRTFKFPLPGFVNFLPCGVTYLAGAFYCVTTRLEVGVFNLARQEWQLMVPSGGRPSFYTDLTYNGSIIHSDVDLLCYEYQDIVSRRSKSPFVYPIYSCDRVDNVWRFDFIEKRWIKEDNFGNRTIFSTKVTTFSVPAVGKGRDLAGMVITDDQCVSVNGKSIAPNEGWSYAGFHEWMVKEKKSKDLWNMWIDPRPVWRKSDLLKHGEVASSAKN